VDKSETLLALEKAKVLHQNQMDKIEQLLAGETIDSPTPISKMECECGKWFYEVKDEMYNILGAQLFAKLDFLHEKWHTEYVKIYDIFFKEKKKGFFAKITGANKIDPLEQDKAKLYFSELQETTNLLFLASDIAIRRVGALSDTKFS